MYSFALISLFPTAFIGGVSYYARNEEYRYDEFNLYLFLIQIQIRIYEEEI
jgi:hypothetical protein